MRTHERTDEAALTAWRVLELVFQLRNLPAWTGLEPAATGDGFHASRIEAFVRRGEPVRLVLPAFPAKSSNPEKTLGVLPDLGELLALRRLNRLCADIAAAHAPGARLTICSDGRVFSDLVQVTDEAVSAYGAEIRRIIADEGLEHLDAYDLDDVFPQDMSHDERRRALVAAHGEPLLAVRERVLQDADCRQLFNGIHRFLFEDLLALRPELSRTQLRLLSKDLAYETMQRSNAWSRLVESRFPEALRLSIHPQPASSRKIGVRLLPSSSIWRTPWHSAVLFDGKEHTLVRRREAEERGASLVRADGRYEFFVLPGALKGGEHAAVN